MALINCPECGKEISDKAKICINCGSPIAEQDNEKVSNNSNSVIIVEDRKKTTQKKLLISTILSLIGTCIFDIYWLIVFISNITEKDFDADATITIGNAENSSRFINFLSSDSGHWLLFVLFLVTFISFLLTYLIKNEKKEVVGVFSIIISFISSIFCVLYTVSDTCGGLFFAMIPAILYLVSAFITVLSIKEYNAK